MRHAAVRVLIAVATGISLSRLLPVPLWLVAVVVAVAAGLVRMTHGWSLYPAVAVAALLYAQARAPTAVDPRLYMVQQFVGVVESDPAAGRVQRAVVSLAAPWHGKVYLWSKDSTPGLKPGDVVRVYSPIQPLDDPRNPGVTDFNSILAARGFVGSASARASDVVLLARGKGPFILNRLIAPVRAYILRVLGRSLPGTEGELFVGILLGGSSGLPRSVQEQFRDSGISYALAVSGMHVSIVAGVLWMLLSLFGVRGWRRFWASTAWILLYLLLVGRSGAPVRAGLMACAMLLSVPTQRRVSTVASLCACSVLLLVFDPLAVFDAGAQLSFAAFLGIALVARPVEQLVRGLVQSRVARWVLGPAIVSIAAALSTAPLLLHHFYRVQLLAFVAGAVVVPLLGLAMPLGIVVLLANLVSHWLASIFAHTLGLVLLALLKLTMFMGSMGWAIWEPGRLPWLWVGWAYLLGLLALKLRRARARTGFAVLLLSGLAVVAWQGVLRKSSNSVTFLDPKRGDAILLEDSLGHKVLVDAGVNGPGVLRDYLSGRGIHTLDAVIVTHPDEDHYGGLLDLPARVRVRQLLVSTTESKDLDYQTLLARLRADGTDVVVVGKGARVSGLGFGFDFLWPDDATRLQYLSGRAPTNDMSLVASVTEGGFKMLLTGDLDNPDLLAGVAMRADLLKSPHHGSLKGNPEALYQRVQPSYVLVMGRYPTPARLERRFEGTAVNYFDTRVDGAVALRFESGRPTVQRFFKRLPLPGE